MRQRKARTFFHFIPHRKSRLLYGLVLVALFILPFFSLGAESEADEPVDWRFEATNHLGEWIWETNATDKQTVHFWKPFVIPNGAKITNAILRITVDNGYTLYLDGREIGRGSDWRTVTEYDVTKLLLPGRHILAVEGFNDRLEGGLIFALRIDLASGHKIEILSDGSWFIVPLKISDWKKRIIAKLNWHHALVIGGMGHPPWTPWPYGLAKVAALRPVVVPFWQRGWFQLSLLSACLIAVLFSLWLMARLAAQARAQQFLQVERARIARDIHDDLGAQLTQLLLMGEVAQREQPADSPARGQFTEICGHARELAHALDEVVWAVNSNRDTVRHFVSYVCKYAQVFLSPTRIRCRFDVEPDIPTVPLDLHVRRNLFLGVKEALNNAAKYSRANELFLRIFRRNHYLSVIVEDNGQGFDQARLTGDRNGLANMQQRMEEVGGSCNVASQPGGGCLVIFTVPLPRASRRWFPHVRRSKTFPVSSDFPGNGSGQ